MKQKEQEQTAGHGKRSFHGKSLFPTQLGITISLQAPQTEFDLLVNSEELSRLLLKSTRFHRINCRVGNTK